jgi:hypothetical protein
MNVFPSLTSPGWPVACSEPHEQTEGPGEMPRWAGSINGSAPFARTEQLFNGLPVANKT